MKKANTIEIPLEFKNYKLLKDKSITLKGSYIYFIEGSNNKGKTSTKNGLASLMLAKNITDEPVTRGEKQVYIEGSIPGADNKQYLVRFSFDNNNSRFVVVDEDGNKIDSVTKIRDIFKYTHFTAEEFLNMSLTADGRRQQRKLLLNLLSDTERAKYEKSKNDELVYYNKRTEVGKQLESANETLKQVSITEEQKKLLISKNGVMTLLETLKKDLSNINSVEQNKLKITYLLNAISSINNDIDNNKEILGVDATKSLKSNTENSISILNESISKYSKSLSDKEEIDNRITKGEKLKNEIVKIEIQQEMYDKALLNKETYSKEYDDLNNKVESERNLQKEIIKKSNLPVNNISFDDDVVTIDGFSFKETQVCKSSAIKVVAGLMCKLNKAPILLMGNGDELDYNSLNELQKVAEENNKIMVFDTVVKHEQEITVVGYDMIKH
jgi:hypothetical protein